MSMLLEADGLLKRFGAQDIFEIENLAIRLGDRIGLVGRNGAGKSTLLSVLSGESQPDSGIIRRHCDVAVIRQSGEPEADANAQMCSLLKLRGSACKSGGEQTRLAIAAAFSMETPLLFADEPTTNLDLSGVEALQRLLEEYAGALVIVSHDRTLLDQICTQIWELEDGKLRVFSGTYSDFMKQKQRERDFQQFEYEQYRVEQERLTGAIQDISKKAQHMNKTPKRMGNSEARLHRNFGVKAKQGKVQGRKRQLESRLEQIAVKERPRDLPQISMPLGATQCIRAKIVARAENITFRYGAHTVLENASLFLPTGSRTVLLGPNGAGKTTLMRAILDAGKFAEGVTVGYFAQGHETLNDKLTVLQNARADSALPEHVVRTILANLYLGAQEMDKPAAVLSGGERAKLQLARLLAARVHLLVLDEPTNHLDIYTLEALESLLTEWQGTLLVATHDRRMAQRVATRLAFLEHGSVQVFEGGMAEWEAEKERRAKPRGDLSVEITRLEIKLAELNSRMSCPRKGDDIKGMQDEWIKLTQQLRKLRAEANK